MLRAEKEIKVVESMKKIKSVLKKNGKLLLGIVIGGVIFGGGVYAVVVSANDVSYDNETSKLSSTNVQGAIDELYNKSTSLNISQLSNIAAEYTYNASSCVTGNEETCIKTDCYKNKTAGSCPTGTIIDYKVNDSTIVRFHVMYDNGSTMTMQSQKNTVNNTMWISEADYATENTDGTSCAQKSCNDEGPMTVLPALERATKFWTNVND